jgi:mRNA-degrading endonuclease RelE of RelBE toxin-antitoxin system
VRFPFTREAQSKLRAIDRSNALRILKGIASYGSTRAGDVEPLHGEFRGCYRLRIGEYRVIFRPIEDGLEILTVGHRSEVYD